MRFFFFTFFFSLIGFSCGQNAIVDYNEGMDLMDQGQYKKAITVFTDGINRKHLASQRSFYGRAYCYYSIKEYDLAIKDIDEGLTTRSMNNLELNRDLYWLKGSIADVNKDTLLELQSYQKALSYDPENPYLLSTIGLIHVETSDYEDAISTLRKAIEINDQDAFAYNNLALAYIRTGEYELAFKQLGLSKLYDKENPFVYENYYYAYSFTGEDLKACEFLKVAISKDILAYGSEEDLIRIRNSFENNCN